VRHLGEVRDDRAPLEVAAERNGQVAPRATPLGRVEQLAELYQARRRIRDLDPDRRLAGG